MNLLVNIIAIFIFNKDKRRQFRNKYKRKSKFARLREDIAALQNGIRQLRNDGFLYRNTGAIEWCKNFYNEIDKSNFEMAYKGLIIDLDEKGVEEVTKVLSRMKLISMQNIQEFRTGGG